MSPRNPYNGPAFFIQRLQQLLIRLSEHGNAIRLQLPGDGCQLSA
jgi:hypothetical protein